VFLRQCSYLLVHFTLLSNAKANCLHVGWRSAVVVGVQIVLQQLVASFTKLSALPFHNMHADCADMVARECRSSSTQSSSKQAYSTLCQTGESKDSKRSLALSHAEVSFS